jgi:2-polyprenyl-6-hydroxyphenyl methylase/3-demethylubiquinone-9 3-methyltransferase
VSQPTNPSAAAGATPDGQFDFGENWKQFSARALTPARIAAARVEFQQLFAGVPLAGRSFLEIGFGQGLSLLFAAEAGARVVGCDINPKCAEALRHSRTRLPVPAAGEVPLVIGSILEPAVAARLGATAPAGDKFYDIVHSWGVLHHTGDMAKAVAHAAALVRPGGHFVVAIYNRHWSSLPWLWIKWLYVRSPRWLQRALLRQMSPIIFVAKWLVTGKDPRLQQRGMDFYFNVVDWVGGYPYEYASIPEFARQVAPLGFTLVHSVSAEVPTGCNEFVFLRHQ